MDEKKEKIEAEVLESNLENKIEDKKNMEQSNGNTVTMIDDEKTKKETNKEDELIKENKQTEAKNENKFKRVKTHKKSKKFTILAVITIIIIIIIALFSTIFALINSNNDKILGGIYIGDRLVEGLTEQEAINILTDEFKNVNSKEIMLKVNGETYSITPEQIEVKYNVEKAVQEAYNIGRNGNIFENNFKILQTMLDENKIDVEFSYNDELLVNFLKGLNAKLPNAMIDNTYCVEDDELIITRGIDGLVIDIESAKQAILEKIKAGNSEEIELKTEFKKCPDIDIEKIHSEVKTEPQNASYKTNPYEIIPHKNGLDFDVEAAKTMLKEEKEEYVIKLTVTEPETLTNEIGDEAFPDLLSSFSTKYDETNRPRTKNVKLAMEKLNGVVVMPGETFSYNQTLGKRTAEAGYEYANGFAGGKVVPMLAGGICQVSSTLYDAVLYANLDIVERYNHMFQATYVEPGKDATVVYGSLDFKFKNTRNYPIMIKTTAGGGLAEIKIFGIREEVEYDVDIITEVLSYTPYKVVYEEDTSLAPGQEKVSQWGLQGCKSITYRIVSLNGQEVSKEVLSTDTYSPLNKIVKRGPKVIQEPIVDTSATPEPAPGPVETQPTLDETPTPEPETPDNPVEPETPEEPENSEPIENPEISDVPETPEIPEQ